MKLIPDDMPMTDVVRFVCLILFAGSVILLWCGQPIDDSLLLLLIGAVGVGEASNIGKRKTTNEKLAMADKGLKADELVATMKKLGPLLMKEPSTDHPGTEPTP